MTDFVMHKATIKGFKAPIIDKKKKQNERTNKVRGTKQMKKKIRKVLLDEIMFRIGDYSNAKGGLNIHDGPSSEK